MHKNELRIGNYITADSGYIFKTLRLDNERGHFDIIGRFADDYFNLQYKDVLGIPLTKHWITKRLLCKKTNSQNYFELPNKSNTIELLYNKTNLGESVRIVTKKNVEPRTAVSKEIKYIHELQNAYFALTGEEFQIIMVN